jgi:formylglycine-generating enzyme required for sulfatase activity
MKPILRLALLLAAGLIAERASAAIPEVSNVTAVQRPGTKLVDITYTVTDADGDALKIRVEVSDNAGVLYSVPAFALTGAIGDNVTPGVGKTIVWDAGVDWDGEYSDQMRVKVIATDTLGFPGLEWGNEIPPGGFLMGQDGGAEGSGPSRHVNIPWSFWMSKFEIRNDQYTEFLNIALAAGRVTRNGTTTSVKAVGGHWTGVPAAAELIQLGDANDIRWNVNNFEVVGGKTNFPVTVTWYGAVAFATQYGYDLPTDAEWEKAARGPDNDDQDEHWLYPWGNTLTGGYANYWYSRDPYESGPMGSSASVGKTPAGYYNGNQTPLGPDTKNGYGLYDLVGNVREWTRSVLTATETYPQAEALADNIHSLPNPDSSRVTRGGDHTTSSQTSYGDIRVWFRKTLVRTTYSLGSNWEQNVVGFRVVRRSTP